jgi:acetyl-CoA acyltransferase 1
MESRSKAGRKLCCVSARPAWGQQITRDCMAACVQDCSAGDSAAYQRRNSTLDDVVIVAALRTPLTKVVRECL